MRKIDLKKELKEFVELHKETHRIMSLAGLLGWLVGESEYSGDKEVKELVNLLLDDHCKIFTLK